MADSKITALTALTAADPTVDMFPVVDVSDTTMAASGTTKRISINNILACSPSATLASATITGDLTVDTSTLKVDSANNRVGIGTLSAYGRLTVGVGSGLQAGTTTNVAAGLLDIDYATTGDINTRLSFVNSNGATNAAIDRIGNPNFNDNGNLAFLTRSGAGSLTERYRIAADGVATWSNVGGFAGTAMTLNSTGLGVGETAVNGIKLLSAVTTAGLPATSGTTQSAGSLRITATNTTGCLDIGTSGALSWLQACRRTNLADNFDLALNPNGGNVGIGVTPSAGKGCLQLSSGINFPATQVTSSDANTLDDYEEGTWTPSVGGTATYTTQTGRYVKIGNRVFITLRMTINTIGTGDDYRISGLPFQPAALLAAASVGFFANLKISANFISGYASTASSVITMTGTTAASANVTNGIGVFGNGSDIAMSCFYEV